MQAYYNPDYLIDSRDFFNWIKFKMNSLVED